MPGSRRLRAIVDVPTLWIPLREGRRLAARVWLPVDAEEHPVPAILEAIPYVYSSTGNHSLDYLLRYKGLPCPYHRELFWLRVLLVGAGTGGAMAPTQTISSRTLGGLSVDMHRSG